MNRSKNISSAEVEEASQNLTSKSHQSNQVGEDQEDENMKRAAAKELIERYYHQLMDGCGDLACTNQYCASSGRYKDLHRNQAAVMALELLKKNARLCPDFGSTSKVAKHSEDVPATDSNSSSNSESKTPTSVASTSGSNIDPTKATTPTDMIEDQQKSTAKDLLTLSEEKAVQLLETCHAQKNYTPLVRLLGQVFSSQASLNASFLAKNTADSGAQDHTDSCSAEGSRGASTAGLQDQVQSPIDLDSLRRTYEKLLMREEDNGLAGTIATALVYLSSSVEVEVRCNAELATSDPNYLNMFLIVMEIPVLQNPEFLDQGLVAFLKAMGQLPVKAQARIARIWARYPIKNLKRKLETFQQLITIRVLMGNYGGTNQSLRSSLVNDDDGIMGAAKCLRMVYYASILAGQNDPPSTSNSTDSLGDAVYDLNDLLGAVAPKEKRQIKQDPLEEELGLRVIDCRSPSIPFTEFYNESLNDVIEMDKDYTFYKADSGERFSFLRSPFLLTPASKNSGLFYDNRISMYNERRITVLHGLLQGQAMTPYLKLKVRRSHLVEDSLVQLEMVAMENPSDLKKQLFVEFEGEQGVDEGGVSKEFFQLIIEELFNPDIGMFRTDLQTRNYWFNGASYETDAQFTLIGIILGLAIYNNIILDVSFPMVIYNKMVGKKGFFTDMQQSHPTIYSSLKYLLEFDGDVEETFLQSFEIGLQDLFGSPLSHELKENGRNISVTKENREEFVQLYADYVLNKSIEKQFGAFKRGFSLVTDESPLKLWFRPEEIELLVCGSKEFDFEALEEATVYDGGFTTQSPTVKNFWEVVHSLSEEEKKQLLQFTTGSDRVPVGGLAKLRLIIAKNGPDSERLPTAHTCFNVLLLPDYSSKETLKERLVKAITHAKGFGML